MHPQVRLAASLRTPESKPLGDWVTKIEPVRLNEQELEGRKGARLTWDAGEIGRPRSFMGETGSPRALSRSPCRLHSSCRHVSH